MVELLGRNLGLTAVFAYNDSMAAGALTTLKDNGIAVRPKLRPSSSTIAASPPCISGEPEPTQLSGAIMPCSCRHCRAAASLADWF
jgi:hypothetical protein